MNVMAVNCKVLKLQEKFFLDIRVVAFTLLEKYDDNNDATAGGSRLFVIFIFFIILQDINNIWLYLFYF